MPTTATDRAPEANPAVSPLGSLLTPGACNEKARQRLMAKVTIADTPHPRLGTPCWNHGGAASNRDGHRYFWYSHGGVKEQHAHRTSFRVHRGEIPSGMHVRHQCDNPACVNPDHLELGTHQQNMSDKALRNPGRAASGIKGVYRSGNGWSGEVPFMGKLVRKWHKRIEDAAAWVNEQRQRLHGRASSHGFIPAAPLASSAQLALF